MPGTDPGMRRAAAAIVPGLLAMSLLAADPVGAQVMDDELFTQLLIDQLEYRLQDGDDLLAWEGQGRIGNDRNKAVVKSEGEYLIKPDEVESAEVQLLYQRLISDFFDAQAGLRYDFAPGPSRAFGVLGINGLAPGWFEVDASLFVSEEANVLVRLEADYDLLLTQRLVLQPAVELNLASADDRDVGIASGLNDIELGLRLRYEILRSPPTSASIGSESSVIPQIWRATRARTPTPSPPCSASACCSNSPAGSVIGGSEQLSV